MYTVYIWLVSPVRSLSGLYFVSNRGAVREISDVNISRVLLSPDGRPIVYTRAVARDHNEHLWVVGLDGRDGRELYAPPANVWVELVGWSPDGRSILFERDSRIMQVPAEGGEPELTGITVPSGRQQSKPMQSLFPSPDGTRLAIRSSGWAGEAWAIDDIGALVARGIRQE
jgi:Tol biopolymer transport system component